MAGFVDFRPAAGVQAGRCSVPRAPAGRGEVRGSSIKLIFSWREQFLQRFAICVLCLPAEAYILRIMKKMDALFSL